MISCLLALFSCVIALCGCVGPTASQVGSTSDARAEFSDDAYHLIIEGADHEALYTLVGGLKPMSNGIWRGSIQTESPDLTELRHVRSALAPLRNQTWYADVQVFHSAQDGKRYAEAYVVHRAALARMMESYSSFWNRWGVTPETHPAEVVAVVDRMPKAERWRGYGYLFGYPVDAVDFFVAAGMAAEGGREIGSGKDRKFIHLPTYSAATGRFTYAVAMDHASTHADKALASQARLILEAYRLRRGMIHDVKEAILEFQRLNQRFEPAAMTAAHTRDTRQSELASPRK